jgi:arginine utilization protein RocB
MPTESHPEIQALLEELVAVRSDTGTLHELAMADKLLAILRGDPYFVRHPDLCGAFEAGDVLHRPVVWGLRRGRSRRTVILEGHYDTVEIDCYGALKPFALEPAALRSRMREQGIRDPELARDLEDEAWGFGRGMADMKAGLAINLHTLLSREEGEANILFLAVPDEESMSSGAIQAVHLLGGLRERFGLDYRLLVLTEPQGIGGMDLGVVRVNGGGMGKMLPVVLTKGVLTHSAEILKGLNSASMLAEIVRAVELNTDLVCGDQGQSAPPPATQIMRDLKTGYDVSVPEFSAACFNVMFLKTRPPLTLLEDLRRICADAADRVVRRYHEAFSVMAGKGSVGEAARRTFEPEVLTLGELEQRLEADPGFEAFRRETTGRLKEQVGAGQCTLPDASIRYLKALAVRAGFQGPAVVLGISPPYYPAVSNAALGQDIAPYLEGLDAFLGSRYRSRLDYVPYRASMTDLSYTSCTDPDAERRFLGNLALAPALYDVPVERIAQLNVPVLAVGPAGRDLHKAGERVYLPDVTGRIPELIARVVDRV